MPVSSVAMAVEGVLMKPTAAIPIPIGIALYHSLKENFNILLYSDQDSKTLDHWLSIEALRIHSAVEYNEGKVQWLSDSDRKLSQVNALRHRGFKIELVIEPDPEASAWLVSNGFNVLTLTHSQYAMPKWRPDYTGPDRTWSVLEDTVNKLAELKALDYRLQELDEESEWR
jgi:hypothetical protein